MTVQRPRGRQSRAWALCYDWDWSVGRVVRFLVWAISAAFRPRVLLIGESLPAAAAAGAAAQAPATAVTQRRPALLDYCQPMVWWLAWFTPHCETRDGVEVASSGLACLLVVAVTSAAGEGWSSPDSPRTSGAHPTDNHRKSALGSKADPS
jgi:hypothetical protein